MTIGILAHHCLFSMRRVNRGPGIEIDTDDPNEVDIIELTLKRGIKTCQDEDGL